MAHLVSFSVFCFLSLPPSLLSTTHMTGIATDIGLYIGNWLRWGDASNLWRLQILVPLLVFFWVGAALGAYSFASYGTNSLFYPAGLTLLGGCYFFVFDVLFGTYGWCGDLCDFSGPASSPGSAATPSPPAAAAGSTIAPLSSVNSAGTGNGPATNSAAAPRAGLDVAAAAAPVATVPVVAAAAPEGVTRRSSMYAARTKTPPVAATAAPADPVRSELPAPALVAGTVAAMAAAPAVAPLPAGASAALNVMLPQFDSSLIPAALTPSNQRRGSLSADFVGG